MLLVEINILALFIVIYLFINICPTHLNNTTEIRPEYLIALQ